MAIEAPILPFIDQSPDVLRKVLSEFFDALVVFLNDQIPSGTVFAFAGITIPEGWLECDGATYDQETYKALAKSLGQSWGGTGSQFQVPDYREKVPFGVSTTYPLASEEGNFGASGNIGGAAVYYIIKT